MGAEKGEESKERPPVSGKSDDAKAPPPRAAVELEPVQKSKKAKASDEQKLAKQAEAERRKQERNAAIAKNEAKAALNPSLSKAARAKQALEEEEHARAFKKAQERNKKASAAPMATTKGRFAAFDSDSD